jgi:hypothetical protein
METSTLEIISHLGVCFHLFVVLNLNLDWAKLFYHISYRLKALSLKLEDRNPLKLHPWLIYACQLTN